MEILRVDMSKLKGNKFYEDPNFYMGDAVYSYDNIPPYAIENIKSVLVNYHAEEPGPNPYIK